MDIRRIEKEETYTRKVPYLVIELSVAEAFVLHQELPCPPETEQPTWGEITIREFFRHILKFLEDSPQNDW